MARVLQVCNTDFYLNRFLAPLVLELAARGHEVECAFEGSAPDPRLAAAGVRSHAVRFPRRGSPLGFVAAIRRLREVMRAGGYDCVNSHNRNASIAARVAAWLERVPANVYTAHGFYFHDGQSRLVHELTVWIEALLARITHLTLSQSREDVEYVVRRRLIRPERIRHIGNGIDTTRFHPRPAMRAGLEKKLGLVPGAFRVASVGRIVRGKGLEDLVSAYARFAEVFPESQLLLIGGNISQDIESAHAGLVAQIAAAGLGSRVRITGIVDNVEEYLAASDLFVLPSYREGVPRSLMEAMAAGLACIATDIRGCRELVQPSETGLLYRPGDVEELARLMAHCAQDPADRARLAKAAAELAAREFSEGQYVARQVAALEKCLTSR